LIPLATAEHRKPRRIGPKGGRMDAATSQRATDGPSGEPDEAEKRGNALDPLTPSLSRRERV